ncbi:MAG TPA: hypothetical protein PLQ54_17275 [Armatimonadota bacterium]|nr:hypothetical protein [Armatimonadota bacterium]
MEGLATAESRLAGITHVCLGLGDTRVVDGAGAWTAFLAAGELVHRTDGVDDPMRAEAMVGNSPESDVAGAQAVGRVAVWLNREGLPRERGPEPDAEIRSLKELPRLLEAGGAAGPN